MSRPTAQELLKLPYERVLIPEEEGGYSAYIAEFEGCMAEGETADEALNNLEQAAVAWISAEQEAGREIPEAWNLKEFSGKVLLRLPKSLHRDLSRHAQKEAVSLNQYVLQKLSAQVQLDQIMYALHSQIQQSLWLSAAVNLRWEQTPTQVYLVGRIRDSIWNTPEAGNVTISNVPISNVGE